MVVAQVLEYFTGSSTQSSPRHTASFTPSTSSSSSTSQTRHDPSDTKAPRAGVPDRLGYLDFDESDEEEIEEPRPDYVNAMLAGGLGGLCGDMLMHSLDTVKTRQQGDPHRPPKYRHLTESYVRILKQEGVPRGLYGGAIPAAIGSFGGTCIFFGTYEFSKRWMIDSGVSPAMAYLTSGLVADLVASPVYVPTEVIKTRLQLQGRHNNPVFHSGYNYRSSRDALSSIIRNEGWPALFHGYRATLYRDLPFSALQFAFYEKERAWAKKVKGKRDLGLGLELFTGMTAGGLAGTITCPLDVVKTRIQTQLPGGVAHGSGENNLHEGGAASSRSSEASMASQQAQKEARSQAQASSTSTSSHRPSPNGSSSTSTNLQARRAISTSSPSTTLSDSRHATQTMPTSSVMRGLQFIYQTEGVAGLFRGVGPRAVWTSVQSGTMLVLYQVLLKYFEEGKLGLS